MSEVAKALANLQRRRAICVSGYRKSRRTGLEFPVYSLDEGNRGSSKKRKKLDVHSLLAGVTSERLAEYDFVARNLVSPGRKAAILDIGSAGSGLARAIERFGGSKWQVLGIDLAEREGEEEEGGERGCDARMDARSTGLRSGSFDQVVCISTVEHIGLSCGISDGDGDAKAMKEMYRVLKKGGSAIISIPYGNRASIVRQQHRVYDSRALVRLAARFFVAKKEFYRYRSGRWLRCSQAAAGRAADNGSYVPSKFHSAACTCLLLKKKRQ